MINEKAALDEYLEKTRKELSVSEEDCVNALSNKDSLDLSTNWDIWEKIEKSGDSRMKEIVQQQKQSFIWHELERRGLDTNSFSDEEFLKLIETPISIIKSNPKNFLRLKMVK